MEHIEEQIKRKIKVRKFAYDNSALNEQQNKYSTKNSPDDRLDQLFDRLQDPLQDANICWYNTDYRSIHSHRKVMGTFIIYGKKVIRKIIHILLGWYIDPILRQQTQFNADVVNCLNLLKDISNTLMEQEIGISQNGESIREELRDVQQKLETQIREQEVTRNRLGIQIKEQEVIKNQLEIQIREQRVTKNQLEQQSKLNQYMSNRLNITCDLDLINNIDFDYFKFENAFRGSRIDIKQRYLDTNCLQYFKPKGGYVLDIGCGRGEFLELLQEQGIQAKGVDMYTPFIEYCKNRSLDVVQADALTFLSSLEDGSLDGVFMSHVAEHLSKDYLIALIRTAYRKLKNGCYFVLDTPNPEALATYRNFYIDLDHIKPVPYLTLEYLFKDTGFEQISRYDNPNLLYFDHCYHIESDSIQNLDECNHTMDLLNNVLFSSADYMLIARK